MEMFNNAIKLYKPHAFKLAGITLLYSIISLFMQIVMQFVPIVGPIAYNVLFLIGLISYIRLFMQIINNQENINIDDSFNNIKPSSLKFIGLTFIKAIVLCFMLFLYVINNKELITMIMTESTYNLLEIFTSVMQLFIVVMFIFVIFTMIVETFIGFASFVMIDEDFVDKSFKDSIIDGYKMMKGYRLKFILVQVLSGVLHIIGLLMLGMGTLFTTPLSITIMLNLYNEAKENYFGYEHKILKQNDINNEF